ncbi:glycosyltransferase family 4 protein [Vreelandella utahensis]|uniref:glycosyltransferase family 4 protein n=1 Tax=Vreelandella halophila TaxID=86177 RepID=UPI0009879493|nr:glycosyltransferase family 4 protein [Halomonas utahensis]
MEVLAFARHPGGGIRTYIYYVYSNAAFSDTNITLLTPETDSMDSLLAGMNNVGSHVKSKESVVYLLISIIRTLLKVKPQVLHSHGFTAGLLAVIPARLLGVPHVITTHDVLRDAQFQGVVGRLKRRLIGRVLSLATVINPVGKDAARNLQDNYSYLNGSRRMVSIRNGIDTNQFLGDQRRDVREEAGVAQCDLLAGFFGRFMAQKGFSTLVEAVAQWNSREGRTLKVACFGWGGFIREEQAELTRRGLMEYFHFFPGTDEMAEALRGVDAVVIPSRWEACPLLPMEAFVAGVPVIASTCIGLNEVVHATPALTFEVESVEGLLQCLERFANEEDALKERAEAFRSEAASRFDVAGTARSLKELFMDVAK